MHNERKQKKKKKLIHWRTTRRRENCEKIFRENSLVEQPFPRRFFELGTRLLTDPPKRIKIRRERFSADSVLRMFDLFFSFDVSYLTLLRHKLRSAVKNLGLISRTNRKKLVSLDGGKFYNFLRSKIFTDDNDETGNFIVDIFIISLWI